MRDHARRRPPLPVQLAPAERDFFVELRRLVDAAGLSFRTLEQSTSAARSDAGESAFYSKSQWGRWLNGQSQPPRRAVRKLAEKLGDDDISAEHLVDLWERAFVPTASPQAAEATAVNVRDIQQQDAEMPGQLDPRSEADFLGRYRRHVIEYHGMLEPPDFEYRRRVRVADLYVPPAIVQIIRGSPALPPRKVTLQQFSEEITGRCYSATPAAVRPPPPRS